MTETDEQTWAVIWTSVVDHRDGEPSVSLHTSLATALAKLRSDYDPENKFADERNSDFLFLVEDERNLFIQVHPIRVNLARFQPIDDEGWKAMENWEAEMDNA